MSLNHVLSILWRRLWLVLVGLVATIIGAAVVVSVVPPRYDAVATASVDLGRADPITGAAASPTAARSIIGSLLALIESQKIATDVIRRLNLTNDPQYTQEYLSSGVSGQLGLTEWLAGTISKNVEAKLVEGTTVINLRYRSTSPIQAALMANTYMAAFEDAVVDMKIASAQQTSNWYEPQVERLREALDGSRQKLVQYQRTAKLLAPSQGGGDSDASPLMSTSGDLASAKAQLLALQSQLAAVDAGQTSSKTSLLDSPMLSSLKASLASTNAELSRARIDLGSNNPKVQALLASQRALQDQIATEIGTVRSNANAKIQALNDQITKLEANYSDQYGKMISVQAQRDELMTLQKEVAFRQEQLDGALRATASAKMEGQLSFSNLQTLDNATPPPSATFPKIPLIAALAIGAGLALGVIFALIAEALDRRIRVVADLNYSTDVPLLGVISRSKFKGLKRPRDKGFSLTLPAPQR